MKDTELIELVNKGLKVIPDRLASYVETLLNQYLRLDLETRQRMSALTGKIIAIDVWLGPFDENTPHITLYFVPENQRCQVNTLYSGDPDVIIRGTPLRLMGQLFEGGPMGKFDDLAIEGDLALGKAFQKVLRGVEIDWEEQLAHRVGDLPAHQMGNGLRQLRQWSQRSLQNIVRNTGEYLHYEAHHLPPPGALNEFMDAVDKIHADTERLEARIQRLQSALTVSPSNTGERTRGH